MNSELPSNRILDAYSNINKINRVKDEVNDIRIQKMDENKFNNEKHSNGNADGIVKIDVKDKKKYLKMRKNQSQTHQLGTKMSSQ